MKHKRNIILAAFVAILTLLQALPVFAAEDAPDTYGIVSVKGYQGLFEAGDQGYFISFAQDYTGADPDYNTDEAVLFRLLDDVGDPLAAIAPYSYPGAGWIDGVVWIYFSAADAPAWADEDFVVEMAGNPGIDWVGGVWSDQFITIEYSDYSGQLPSVIKTVATQLATPFGVDLVEQIAGVWKLTELYGEPYFEAIIPGLRILEPILFSGLLETPDSYGDREWQDTHATTVEAQLDGTPFDTTDLAIETGVSRAWITGGMYFLALGITLVFLLSKFGDARPGLFITGFLCIAGSLLGFLPFVVASLSAAIGAVLVVWALFFKAASA